MKVLVINAGSSSIKYQLIDMTNETLMAKGQCDRIGIEGGNFKHVSFKNNPDGETKKINVQIADHAEGIKLIVDALTKGDLAVIDSMKDINAVGHRVVHGGEEFSGSVLITDAVIESLKKCSDLSPLHNPANLTGIRACTEIIGDVPQVGVFDTGFHQTMPDYSYIYPIPYEYYEKYKLRKYGFHGTSHRYVTARCAAMLGKKPEDINIVTCHLGNGSSITAVKGGQSFDTTMGVTPLDGLMMGTRSGSIDPAIIPFIMKKEGLTADEVDTILNKKSGMLGVTQVTSDNRDIEEGAKAGNKRYQLVESMLCHQITKYIGGFAAAMGGVDAIVFTGGIGENNPQYRTRVAANLGFMGVAIDEEINKKAFRTSEEFDISTKDAKVRMMVIPTNEELMIARDTYEIVTALNK